MPRTLGGALPGLLGAGCFGPVCEDRVGGCVVPESPDARTALPDTGLASRLEFLFPLPPFGELGLTANPDPRGVVRDGYNRGEGFWWASDLYGVRNSSPLFSFCSDWSADPTRWTAPSRPTCATGRDLQGPTGPAARPATRGDSSAWAGSPFAVK